MKYTDSHEWIRLDGKRATVGISCHAQKELGEIVYIELPKVGKKIKGGEEIAVLESTKAAADIYAPISGTITKVNRSLNEDVSAINHAPETEGWLFEIEPTDPSELDALLDPDDYLQLTT